MRTRTMILAATGMLAAGAVGYGAAVALDDPDRSVDAIAAGGFTTATTSPDPNAPDDANGTTPDALPVDGLEQLVGELRSGDDADDWEVAGVEVDFGPDGWLQSGTAPADLDGDGSTDAVVVELRGLEGREVTLGVRYEVDEPDADDADESEAADDRDADVFTIDGITYRDPAGGPAAWESTTDQPEASRDGVAAAAVAAVGAGAEATDVDRDTDDGWDGWEVDVRGADGREYQVLLDPAGEVVDVRADD